MVHLARVAFFEATGFTGLVSHSPQLDLFGFTVKVSVFFLVVSLFARFTSHTFILHDIKFGTSSSHNEIKTSN